MAWWKTDATGRSFVQGGKLAWGDGPADAMNETVDAFHAGIGRYPTEAEILAGFRFSRRGAKRETSGARKKAAPNVDRK